MKHFIVLFGLILFAACPGDKGKGLPDTTVPDLSPDEGLFGIWTLKGVEVDSGCPDLGPETAEEEYRIYPSGDGCALDDEDEQGYSLSNSEMLFDDELTVCHAGGNVLTLTIEDTISDGECTAAILVTSRLELTAEGLSGTYGARLDVEGDCPEGVRDCQATATLTGVRGRQLSQAPQEGVPSEDLYDMERPEDIYAAPPLPEPASPPGSEPSSPPPPAASSSGSSSDRLPRLPPFPASPPGTTPPPGGISGFRGLSKSAGSVGDSTASQGPLEWRPAFLVPRFR